MDTNIPLFIHGHEVITPETAAILPENTLYQANNNVYYCDIDGNMLATIAPVYLSAGKYGIAYIGMLEDDCTYTTYPGWAIRSNNILTQYFGLYGISISGDYVAVCSIIDDQNFILEVFKRNGTSYYFYNESIFYTYQFPTQITIDLDGSLMAVATEHDESRGTVYIFELDSYGNWGLDKIYTGNDLGYDIGAGNVAISNGRVIFKSYDINETEAFIHVAEKISGFWTISEIRKDVGANFGNSISIDGNLMVASNYPSYFSIYEYNGYSWNLQQDVNFASTNHYPPIVRVDNETVFCSTDILYSQGYDTFLTYKKDSGGVWKKHKTYRAGTIGGITVIGPSVKDIALDGKFGIAIDHGLVYIYDLEYSNSPTLYIEGGYPSSSIPLYTQAEVPYSTTMNLYLDGSHYMYNTLTLHIGAPSKTMTLFTKSAYFDQYNLLPLYIAAPEGNSTTLYTLGHEVLSYSPLNLFTKGKGLLNESLTLYTLGAQLASTTRFLYLEAAATGTPNSYIDLFTIGGNVGSSYYESDIPLFIQNDDDHLRSIFLYIKNDETELYGNRSIYLYLKSETPSITATLPCYIQNDGLYEVITLHVQGAGMFPGFSVSKRGIPLFIGRDGISKGVPLFCKAIDNSSNSYISLFTRSTIAENEHIPLYIDGYGLSNSYINLSINGTYLDNSSLNLVIPNVIDIPTSTLLLYTHGY